MKLTAMQKRALLISGGALLFVVVVIAGISASSPLSPVAVKHPPAVPARIVRDAAAQPLSDVLNYPEAFAIRHDGGFLLGTEKGDLLRADVGAGGALGEEALVAHLAGHPIGLVPDAAGEEGAWSATFPVGLQHVVNGKAAMTIAEVGGVPLAFPDDVAIDKDGVVYVTDASAKYNPETTRPGAPFVFWDFLEGRGNGRLIAYDPRQGTARVALDGLYFPSGVVLTPDASALLMVEVTKYRVIRYALTGPARGSVSVYADNLPGIPDDVFIGPHGRVWVTIAAPRSAMMDGLIARHPLISRLLSALPYAWQQAMLSPQEGAGGVLLLGADGAPECLLEVKDGAPPANGAAYGDKLALGRLGDGALLAVDPGRCRD